MFVCSLRDRGKIEKQKLKNECCVFYCPAEQVQTAWCVWAASCSLSSVGSPCYILGMTMSTWLHHRGSPALICSIFLNVENLCLGLSPPLLAFHSVIVAAIACLVVAPAKAQDTTLGFPKFCSFLFYVFPDGTESAI